MNIRPLTWSFTTVALLMSTQIIFAQQTDNDHDESIDENSEIEEVVVSAHPFSHLGLTQSSYLLSDEDLSRALKSNLGATLEALPGVHNNAFGAAVGRPVIRGLDGPRVKVLTDATSTMDIGVSYTDHPLMAEAFTAERIELINGATTLLYGSGAIGGIVNVVSEKFPKELLSFQPSSELEMRYLDNGGTSNLAFQHQSKLTDTFTFYFDGFNRDGSSYEIPDCPEIEALHEDHHEDEHEDEHADDGDHQDEMDCSTLTNSDLSMHGGTIAGTLFGDYGSVGFALTVNGGEFGVPIHFEHGHLHEEEEHEDEHHDDEHEEEQRIRSELNQTRFDIDSKFKLGELTDWDFSVRAGFSQYEQTEREEHVASQFNNDANDIRFEAHRLKSDTLSQIYGVHLENRDFTFNGDVRLNATNRELAGFALYRFGRDLTQYEFGFRLGSIITESNLHEEKNFTSFSFAAGTMKKLADQTSWSINTELSARAPVIEELFIDGLHVASGSIERGDPNLSNETLWGISSTVHHSWSVHVLDVSVGYRRFGDFIFSQETGEMEHEIPVYQHVQTDANFFSLETLWAANLFTNGEWDYTGEVKFDMVNGRLDMSGNDVIPRQPPNRVQLSLISQNATWTIQGVWVLTSEVTDVADHELPTDSWMDVGLSIEYAHNLGDRLLKLSFQGKNLTDDSQRLHVSPFKDRVLQRGRNLEFSIRLTL